MQNHRPIPRPLLTCAALVATAVIATPSALGHAWFSSDSGDPLRWFATDLSVRMSTAPPENLTWADTLPLIDQAFDTWAAAPGCATPEVTRLAETTDVTSRTTPERVCVPADNVIVFIADDHLWAGQGHSPTWIALTSIAHDETTGEIIDADIEINDVNFDFSITPDGPSDGEVDLLAALTHEVGHFYGLDHSTDREATMFARYTNATDPIGARDLHTDDVDGICALYADAPIAADSSCAEPEPAPPDDCQGGGGSPPWPLALALGVLWIGRRRLRVEKGLK